MLEHGRDFCTIFSHGRGTERLLLVIVLRFLRAGDGRPVSLKLVAGNLLERVLRGGIYLHLERQGAIRNSHHSFMRGESSLLYLLEVLEEVTKIID